MKGWSLQNLHIMRSKILLEETMLTSSYLPPFRALLPTTLVLFAGSFRTSSSRYRDSQACTAGNVAIRFPYRGLSGLCGSTGAILARSQ